MCPPAPPPLCHYLSWIPPGCFPACPGSAAATTRSPLTFAYLRANLMQASLASVPVLAKKARSAKLASTRRLASLTCSGAGGKRGRGKGRLTQQPQQLQQPQQPPRQGGGRQGPGQGSGAGRQAGRQAGVFQGAPECPPTWGAVWNRLLTCDSMLACSVTASTHRGSPWPAHRSSSRGARQRGEGRG